MDIIAQPFKELAQGGEGKFSYSLAKMSATDLNSLNKQMKEMLAAQRALCLAAIILDPTNEVRIFIGEDILIRTASDETANKLDIFKSRRSQYIRGNEIGVAGMIIFKDYEKNLGGGQTHFGRLDQREISAIEHLAQRPIVDLAVSPKRSTPALPASKLLTNNCD